MKCDKCNGMGKEKYFNGRYYIYITCHSCGGTGEVEMTNEEWFNRLSTETKARITHIVYMAGYRDGFNGVDAVSLRDIKNWLEQPHREEKRNDRPI